MLKQPAPWILFLWALLAAVVYPQSAAFAQAEARGGVTFFLPEDFGKDLNIGYEGFEECSDAPPYICDKVVLKNNDRVILTEDLDFTVLDDFQPENNTVFNDECFDVNITVSNDKAFIMKNNARFAANVTADKEIKLENNALLNGNATSLEPKIQIENNAVINGTCTPPGSVEGGGTCGGVSQCDSGSPILPLTLEKTPSREVVSPGDLLTYTLDFTNEGAETALNSVLTDIVPPGTTFVGASGGGTESADVVTWTGDLGAGESSSVTMDVRVNNGLGIGTIITNNARVTADDAEEAVDSVDVEVSFLPILTLTKVANVEFTAPGEQITYTITIKNVGNITASNITLQDTLDPATTFVSETGGGTESGGVVTWSAAEIQSGAETSVTVTVSVNEGVADGTFIVNEGSVDSDQTAPVNALEFVLVDTNPRLELLKTVDQSIVSAGDVLTYTLNYTNAGAAVAPNAILLDTLPADTTVESISGGGVEIGPGVVQWEFGALDPGENGAVQLSVRVNSPLPNETRLINRATFSADGVVDPAYSEAESLVDSAPVLNLGKVGDKTIVTPERDDYLHDCGAEYR